MKDPLSKVMGDKPELENDEEALDDEDGEGGEADAGQALLDAIKSGDAQAVADAVRSLVAIVSEE